MTDTSDKAIESLRSDVMSQVGDDVQKMFDHEALFKRAAAMIIALQAERNQLITTAEADARVKAAVQKALREHAGREETGESITEKYLRRYPQSKKTKAWEGAMVYLRTQNGIWRPDGHGYTVNFSEAWVMPLADARKIVSRIYEDHGGTYFRATAAAIRPRGVTG